MHYLLAFTRITVLTITSTKGYKMKVDFNPKYNQSFGELFPPTEKQLQRLGKHYIYEYNNALPQIEKMAEDVDIFIRCRKGLTKLDRGFEYSVTRRLENIKNPAKKIFNLLFMTESNWTLKIHELIYKKPCSEIMVKDIKAAKEMILRNAKNSK